VGVGLLAGVLVLIPLGALVRTSFFTRRRSAALTFAPVAAIVALTWFVRSEDDYVGDGTSRWTRYSGGAHGLYWMTVAVTAIAVTLLLAAATRDRPRLGRIGTVAAGIACGIGVVTAIGFSVN
jgi:hypothetical protein